jgi:hypothetical protein
MKPIFASQWLFAKQRGLNEDRREYYDRKRTFKRKRPPSKAGDPANEICVRVRGGLGSARDT